MLSTKIRTTIITLVASAGFAAVAIVPAASQAQWHNYCTAGHCVEHSNYTIGGKTPCESIKEKYNNAYDGLLNAIDEKPLYLNGPSASQVEQERTKQIEEEEARVREAERASFEWGCGVATAARTAPATATVVTTARTTARTTALP
jgi:hypothetical protein